MKRQLTHEQMQTLIHALDVAARAFGEDVKTMNAQPDSAFITERAAKGVAELFQEYQGNTVELYHLLEHSKQIIFDDGEDEEEVRGCAPFTSRSRCGQPIVVAGGRVGRAKGGQ